MNDQLRQLATAAGVRTDGDDRTVATALLQRCGIDPQGPCSEHRSFTIASQGTNYIIERAIRAAKEGY